MSNLTTKADIAKCTGGSCPMKKNCLRYLRPAAKLGQVWMLEVPYEHDFYGDVEECEIHIPKD